MWGKYHQRSCSHGCLIHMLLIYTFFQLRFLVRHELKRHLKLIKKLLVNDKIAASYPTNILQWINLYKQQMNLEKLLGEQVFNNPQFQSVLIFFKFVHPCLLFYLLCCWKYVHRRTSRSSEEESVKCQGWEGRRETESIVWLGREGFKSCSNSTQSFLAGVNWNPVSKGNGCDSGWLQSNMPLNLLKES